jgi:acetoin utilization protein AcuB
MRLHSIRRIPIVVGERLVGLLAEGDLKRAQPSILDASEEDFHRVMDGTQVARIMISNPITVGEDTPLFEAAQTLSQTKFGALPVMRGEQLCGILTDSDLIKSLGELLSQSG